MTENHYTLEPADPEFIGEYNAIVEDARQFQREQGFIQWTNDYPNMDTIREDIREKNGYVLKVNGELAGYLYVGFEGDPTYGEIRGAWRKDMPYAVMHRMALKREFRGRGLSEAAFRLIEELCRERKMLYIRVDTDPENKRMQHVFEKNGFVCCGRVTFQGSDKLAYDKVL